MLICRPMPIPTAGDRPLEAAQAAVENRIRIYTIGFGTAGGGENTNCDQPLLDGGQQFGDGEDEAAVGSRGIDEATLMQVAELSGGAYYAAESASELQQVAIVLMLAVVRSGDNNIAMPQPALIGRAALRGSGYEES